jgi:hypothetical protein
MMFPPSSASIICSILLYYSTHFILVLFALDSPVCTYNAQCMQWVHGELHHVACCMLHGIMGSGIQLLYLLSYYSGHPHHTHHPSTRPSPPPHGDQCEKPPGLIDRTWPPSRRNGSITTGQGCLPRGSCGDQVAEIGRAEINEGGMHVCKVL